MTADRSREDAARRRTELSATRARSFRTRRGSGFGSMARTLKSDKLLFLATLLLVGASVVMVYSASAVQALDEVSPARTASCSSS